MEFVGKAVFFRTSLQGIRGQGRFGPVFRKFVGKAVSTSLKGIRGQGRFGPVLMEFVGKAVSDHGQGHFGPTLMEFVGKAISDHFGPRVWALGFRP